MIRCGKQVQEIVLIGSIFTDQSSGPRSEPYGAPYFSMHINMTVLLLTDRDPSNKQRAIYL